MGLALLWTSPGEVASFSMGALILAFWRRYPGSLEFLRRLLQMDTG